MGFEVLFGACETCSSVYRGKENDLKVLADPKVSKKTECIDVYFKDGTGDHVSPHYRFIFEEHGFNVFYSRTKICPDCLELFRTTNLLFQILNEPDYLYDDKQNGKWGRVYRARDPDCTEFLIPDNMSKKRKQKMFDEWAKKGVIKEALILHLDRDNEVEILNRDEILAGQKK